MGSRGHELYWRIYLLLNEGVPLVSKLIIAREMKRNGSDLDNVLDQNKDEVKASYRLNESEIKEIFPASGGTDINKWTARIFIGVILTLFPASLKQSERKQLRNIDSIQKELCANQDKYVFDDETYEDHKVALEESLSFLASVLSDDDVKKEIAELIDIYTNKPLNAKEIMQRMDGGNFSADKRKQVEVFLDSIPFHQEENDENTNIDVDDGQKSIGNSGLDMQEINADDPNTNNDEKRAQFVTMKRGNYGLVQDDVENLSPCEDDAAKESDATDEEIISSATGSDAASGSDSATGSDSASGSDEIVHAATEGLTEDDSNQIMTQWQNIDLEKCFREKDFESLTKNKLDKWKNKDVNVAVLGRTGVGKSRFINALRGCECKDDPLYAPVGSVETTTEPKAYPHPRNSHLKLWDLPGIGTERFPRQQYIEDKNIAFDSYDIYLIMSSDRFTDDEKYFARKIENTGKVFLFVRTRVDINLEDVDDVKSEVEKMREDCKKNLCDTTLKSQDVYLVSSKFVDHRFLDFGRLVERLVNSLSGLKKKALMFSLHFHTKKLLEEKAVALKSRAVKSALLYACLGAVPIPGFPLEVNDVLISNEIAFYRETLCIADTDLEALARKTGKDVNELKLEYKLKTFDLFETTTKDENKPQIKIRNILKRIAMSAVSEPSSILVLLSGVLGGHISFVTIYKFLKSALKLLLEDAHKMMAIRLKETGCEILLKE